MYYLSKFCRICVQSGVKLLDIDTLDFDSVRLSEKLEVCTKMVVSRESLSTEICVQCITKLRISYQFQDMCKKSTKILQGYLAELIGAASIKVDADSFVSTDLTVTLTPLSSNLILKRKRITKEQRCSLLKQLLTPGGEKIRKERDKFQQKQPHFSGGLRNIINFTKSYEFGWNLEKNCEPTHLDKLAEFSNNFFSRDFSEFRDTILYIIENKDNLCDSDEEEDIFDSLEIKQELPDNELPDCCEEQQFEEVIVEPDIKIKREIFEEENDCAYNFVEASYNEENFKREDLDETRGSYLTVNHHQFPNFQTGSTTAMDLLDRLVGSYSRGHRKTFSQNSVRCRTRNNPYINPTLRHQFLFKSFKCERCNRLFKSPGYLKAHNSKVHF